MSGVKTLPKDGLVIVSMMKDLGITSYEPRVVNQLLEFAIRYVTCVLDDARSFANHSNKKSVDIEDVKLAVMMQLEKVFTTPPPRDLLLEVARTKNNIPLPLVKPHCGIRLPPDRYCFSTCNFRLKYANKKQQEAKSKYGIGTSGAGGMGTTLKVAKGPTGVVVKRPPNVASVARSQALSSVAKPVLKLSSHPALVNSQPGQAKARIQVTPATTTATSQNQTVEVKMDTHDLLNPNNGSNKRKRDDDQ